MKKTSHARRKQWIFTLFMGCADFAAWVLIYFGISNLTGSYNLISASAILVPVACLMFSIALVGAYRYRSDFGSLRYASEHVIASLFAYPVAAFFLFVVSSFGSGPTSSRSIFTISLIQFCVASLLLRRVYWFIAAKSRSEGKFLLIADSEFGPIFYKDYLESKQHQGLELLATNAELLGQSIAGEGTPRFTEVATHFIKSSSSVKIADYEAIILGAKITRLDSQLLDELGVIHFKETPVYTMETFYGSYWQRIPLSLIAPEWPLDTNFTVVQHTAYSSMKRVFDFFLALAALIFLLPLFLLISLAILLLDGRPIFYSQKRTGVGQKPFTLFKFRSMRVGSDQGDRYTQEGDSRVSRLGGFLRITRMDELPQLWNVLLGNMSLIGPRAEWVELVSEYERQITHYHFRHLVRPGITGWAQVNFPYGASLEDTKQKLSYDLYYIKNFSLRLDGEVLLKTLHLMSFGKGR